ncbi:hypothetical protein [Photobacterium carnosum]|uniref:hypothetical protein n=1 Tax=Photobacterium carnosum TaxID=2023717 RepID=UPI001E574442|nr:hypothetical protein [Photobacterium carnosum]MCD9530011.1 hypothetical protein [Photobacterium carnosum]MCF2152985.1 hypothetical protein [Photobacterium carnosum]MCF2214745.1 hypothetical protein [Photobacterium carnosum]
MEIILVLIAIIIWSVGVQLDDDIAMYGIIIPILALIISLLYGSWIWLKTGGWGSVDVMSTFSFIKNDIFNFNSYSLSSYVGFTKINNWYLSTNIGWTVAFVPLLGNILATILENIINKKNKKDSHKSM